MVQSIDRAMSILKLIAEHPDGLALARVVEVSGLPRSTAHRLLHALESCDMVARQPVTGRYVLGLGAVKVGAASLAQIDLRERATPIMVKLRDLVGETVSLNVRTGDARLYLIQIESYQELKASADLGRLYPLYLGAPGRTLLSSLPDEEIKRILEHSEMVSYAPNTPLSRDEVWRGIVATRREGHACAFEELFPGTHSVAAPVRDYTSRVVAALTISGPSTRLPKERLLELTPVLLDAAGSLSEELGYLGRASSLRTGRA